MTEPPEPRRKPYTWAIVLVVVVFLCVFAGMAVAVYLARTTCMDACPGRLPPPPVPTCQTVTPTEVACTVYRFEARSPNTPAQTKSRPELDLVPPRPEGEWPATIFACKPWTTESDAMVLSECAVDHVAPSAPEYAYVLEVDLAREAIEVWSEWRGGMVPTLEQATLAVIHYAEHDAYQPLEDGWPYESGLTEWRDGVERHHL